MSRKITQPVNQVRLTNVAVVRMNRFGKRFEVACYRNKAVNYRQGVETDISEVLQTDRVFANVSKGEFACTADLREAFGDNVDEAEICRRILAGGQLQVSDMERSARMENMTREVAAMVAERCVDPGSGRPYTVETIRDAMREAGFLVHPTRGAKQQFLDCVRLLKEKDVLPIERAKMRLCAIVPVGGRGETERALVEGGAELLTAGGVDAADVGNPRVASGTARVEFLIDPSHYRAVDGIAKGAEGRLEIVRQFVHEEGDVGLESELARKDRLVAKKDRLAADSHEVQSTRDNIGGQTVGNNEGGENNDGEGESSLVQNVAAMSIGEDDNGAPARGVDDGGDDEEGVNSRKANKRAQKKSKKARRREREEASERRERVDAERARREERASRLASAAAGDGTEAEAATLDDGGTGSVGVERRATGDGSAKSCTTCGGSFSDAEYRSHFRGDWHRFNLKLKMQGVPPISESEFQLCDADSLFDGPSL